MDISKKIFITLFTVLLFSALLHSYANERDESPYRFHELTIYALPSPVEFDWSSPSSLYHSYRQGYMASILKVNSYILGHIFVMLTTPLIPEPFYAGMASASRKEQKEKVLKEKVGLGILGIDLEGRMETAGDLEGIIKKYARKGSLAAITYRLNQEATLRILEFIEEFGSKNERGHIPKKHYGGAFWPLYENEGAGCSAFGMAMLELAGILNNEMEAWKVEVNIPMSLIGGEINPGNKVSLKDIKHTHHWHNGSGTLNVDYAAHWIYDPSLIYNWVLDQLSGPSASTEIKYFDAATQQYPRLFADVTHVETDNTMPVFTRRDNNNIFINHFLKDNGLFEDHSANQK